MPILAHGPGQYGVARFGQVCVLDFSIKLDLDLQHRLTFGMGLI